MALNEAETKFFASRGAEVDASLTAPEPEAAPDASSDASAESAPAAPANAAAPPAAAPAQGAPAPQEAQAPQVPLAALHEERRKRAESDATLQQLRSQFEQLQRSIQEAQAPQAPDQNEDPVGYLSFQNQQLQTQIEQMAQWRAQQEQQARQQSQFATLTQHVAAAEQAFRARSPDYDQAAQFALQMEDRRLSAIYPDPGQRAQVLRQEAINVLTQAVQQGRDPAEVLYTMAQQLGYGAPSQSAQGAPVAPAAAPQASAPAAAAAAVVDTIQKGLKQQSVAGAGGSTPPSELTPEMLASISDPAEFNKGWAKLARAAKR